jgi:hypothetical protein
MGADSSVTVIVELREQGLVKGLGKRRGVGHFARQFRAMNVTDCGRPAIHETRSFI